MRVDVHNHVIPGPAVELLRRESAYGTRIDGDRVSGVHTAGFRLAPAFFDPDAKLAELRANGMDAAVLSAAPNLFYYELDADFGAAMCEAANAGLAAMSGAYPDRLWWMALLPLQAPERATAMLEAAAASGAVGVHIGTTVNRRPLDDGGFEPFWAAAERLGMVVMIHPAYNVPNPALATWYLGNAIGNHLETTTALERLICSGVLDRHPALSILAVHGGGAFPYTAGRLRHARQVRPELAGTPEDPWRYIGQIVFDTITHDVAALRYLIARAGVANVLLGTDLPFDMAPKDAIGELEGAASTADLERIGGANAWRVFKLGTPNLTPAPQ